MTVTKALASAEASIAAARARGFKRLGLLGSSFGGAVAIAVAGKYPADISVLALKAPVSDMKGLLERKFGGEAGIRKWRDFGVMDYASSSGDRHPLAYGCYEDSLKHDFYKYASRIEAPTLIVHGAADISVPVQQSRRLLESLASEKIALEEIPELHLTRAFCQDG